MENVNGRVMARDNVNGRGKAPFGQQMSVFLISVARSQSRHVPVADSNALSGVNPPRITARPDDRPFVFAILKPVKSIASKIEKLLSF
jgi:hypothetical protein